MRRERLATSLLLTLLMLLAASAPRPAGAQEPGAERPHVVWEAIFDSADNAADFDSLLARDGAGNVYVAGRARDADSNEDITVLKYGPDGDLLWSQRYNGTGSRLDAPKDIVVDEQGDAVYVTGRSFHGLPSEGGTQYDWVTLKFRAADGTPLWARTFNGPLNASDEPAAMALDPDGNVVVTGYSYGASVVQGQRDEHPDFATIKYDPDGNVLWERRYSGPNGLGGSAPFGVEDLGARDVAVDAAGNVYITGMVEVLRGGRREGDVATLKYSAAGVLRWAALFDGTGADERDDDAHSIALDPAGDVIVLGNNTQGDNFYTDGLILKYRSDNGARLWVRNWGSPDDEEIAGELLVDPADGSIYLGGEADRFGDTDGAVAKFDAAGNFLWEQLYHERGGTFDGDTRIALDGAGNLYAAVLTQATRTLADVVSDIVFLKFAPADGTLVWAYRYDGPFGEFDSLHDLISDGGDHLIAGLSTGTPTGGIDLLTVKLRTSGGTAAPDAASLTLDPATVVGGNDVQGTVTIAAPAPPGGAFVEITSNNPDVADSELVFVPVPRGQTSATFRVFTRGVAARTQVALSGTVVGNGGAAASATLTVEPATLVDLRLDPTTVTGGLTASGVIELNGEAPPDDAVVTLTSSNPDIAIVDATVTVAHGLNPTASFNVKTRSVNTPTDVTITATYNGVSLSRTLTVIPAALHSVTVIPDRTPGGRPVDLFVRLTGPAPSGGITVGLSSSDPARASVPAQVTLPEGEVLATVPVSATAVAEETAVTFTATYGGETREASLTLVPPSLVSLALRPATVTGGGASEGTVTLDGPAPSGGLAVTLQSSDELVASVPATVTVPAGSNAATFLVTTRPPSADAQVTITASRPGGGSPQTATLTVLKSGTGAKDTIVITSAQYSNIRWRPGKHLFVQATSTSRTPVTLTVYNTATGAKIGTLAYKGRRTYSRPFALSRKPGKITVRSSLGGSASKRVR